MSHTVASPAAPVPARDRREERKVIAGTVVGTAPSGQTIPGSIITIQVSNGIPPAPPPPPIAFPLPGGPPPEIGQTVVEIPGLPPITVPVLGPPPPP